MIYEHFADKHREGPILYVADWDRDLAPGASYGPVCRDIYIIECCSSGYGSMIINQQEFPISPGDCYVLLPGDTVTHMASYETPRSGVWCGVDGRGLHQVFSRLKISSTSPYAPREAFAEVYKYIEELIQIRNDTDPGAEFRQAGVIYEMIAALLRHSTVTTDKQRWVQKAVGIIEARYAEHLSTQSLADEVGLDRSYFCKLFAAEAGSPPHAYINSLRVRKACTMLMRKEYSIEQISSAVGLDPQNFTRLFKRETGMTPTEYKKKQ